MKKSATATHSGGKPPPPPAATAIATRLGLRLRRARLMSGHSLRELATMLDGAVSHTQLQKFEAGESSPDSTLLARLSRVLGVRPDYFFKTDTLKLATVEYRSLTKLGVKARQRLEEQAYEFFERYLEVETILRIHRSNFPQADLAGVDMGSLPGAIEMAAEKLRQDWDFGMNPIPNVHAMLEKNGVKVRVLPHEDGFDGFSAFAEGDALRVPVIALSQRWLRGRDRDLPRFRFTALHELAHLHLILPPGLTPKQKENFCHLFAGAFLVPRQQFCDAFGTNRIKIALAELKAIKAEWGISVAAVMKRAHNLGVVTDGRYKAYCLAANKHGWRGMDPGHWAGEEESSRFEPLVLRALAQDLITTTKAAGLLGVSLPELGRKFEMVY